MEKGAADPDRCSQSSSSPSSRSRCLAPFLSKTYDLIEGSGANHIVSWNDGGTGFIVWSPLEFSQFLLPRYFKHCNFSSFIRQLNTYGFKKSASNRWEFQHGKFRRGKRHLLGEIVRRKCLPSVYPSFLKASERRPEAEVIDVDSLVEENKNLQKENSELQLQIAHFKALEVELLDWASHRMGATRSNHKRPESLQKSIEILCSSGNPCSAIQTIDLMDPPPWWVTSSKIDNLLSVHDLSG